MKTPIRSVSGIPVINSVLVALLATAFVIGSASGQETLYNFYGTAGGNISLIQGFDDNFYGTTFYGGRDNQGTVFQMLSDGTLTTFPLDSISGNSGTHPNAGLVQGSDGNFYGTTYWWGDSTYNLGTVFQITPDGAMTTLLSFNGTNGGNPNALVQGSDGNFYGTTHSGGSANLGTVFRITTDGALTTLVSFNATNGGVPVAGLVQAGSGNFYGTTYYGGNLALNGGDGYGTVFKMTPAGVLTTLVSFNATNGGHPAAGLVQGSDGNLYGTTQWGGNLALNGGSGYGTVFKMTPAGVLTTLVSFNATNGGFPVAGLVKGSDGNFYGTTQWGGNLAINNGGGFGTVFQMTTNGSLTTLIAFTGNNGANPLTALVQANDGELYGTTSAGGTGGGGTIYRLNTTLPLNLIQQPDDQTVSLRASVLFQAIALGDTPPAYQWYFNGAALLNATNPRLIIASVQLTNDGIYNVIVTNFSGSVTSRLANLRVDPTLIGFTKITAGSIVNDLGNFTRCVWGDFNNHGFLDLFVCNYDGTNVFYRNNGNGTFTKINTGNPVQDLDYHTGTSGADFDNDGSLDLIAAAGIQAPNARALKLYHNNGDGSFSRASGGVVANQLGFFDAPTWADYDHDGFVDLFVTDNGNPTNFLGGKNLFFHNNGNGTFSKINAGALTSDVSVGWGALWADYDNDGFDDLLVINLVNNGHNFLYHNNQDGTFTRIPTNAVNNAVAADIWTTGAQGGAWGDYDNDGLLDLYVTDNYTYNGPINRLYHNDGNGDFSSVISPPSPLGSQLNGVVWGDYDNDGYLDLFMASSSGNDALYHNNGDGTFTQILNRDPVNDGGANSCAWVDYDNDGFLDLFVTRGGPANNLLYHNNGNSNTWLEVKLVGTVANRSAIGAKVRVHATINGENFWQMREINTGGGWNSVPLVAHFGLGDATNIDTLRIEWPSGTVQEFQNVAAKQSLTITEPPRLLVSVTNGVPQFSLKGGRGFQYEIDSSTDLSAWSSIGTVTITNLNGIAQIVDASAPAANRFYRAKQQ